MTVDEYLMRLIARLKLGPEDSKQYNVSIEYLKSKLWGEFQGSLDSVDVIGSFDRETMLNTSVNIEPDIDVLIVFKKNQFKSQTYLSQFQRFAEKNYANSEVFQSHPTIAVGMNHVRFELIPSYRDSGGLTSSVNIPAPRRTDLNWIKSDPYGFKGDLDSKNSNNNMMITPIILLLKYWNVLNGKLFSSYFLEEFCVVNRSYMTCNKISEYFYEIINDLANSQSKFDDNQNKIISLLYERRRRLIVLEKNNMADYVETEFSQFLPMC
jgi:hypothetical protein